MKRETAEWLAETEASASNMPYHDQTNFLLTALIRQVARLADSLESIDQIGVLLIKDEEKPQ